jgi:DNA-binding SARP family transcriptional activator
MHLSLDLLGAMEIRLDGRRLPRPAGRVRVLLAMFLLDGEQTVTRTRALLELWGDRPPESARANLRTYLSGLRSWLADAQAPATVAVQPRGAAWTLDFGPDVTFEVDVSVFDTQLGLGRAAVTRGDLSTASAHLAAAVGCHRGTPLLDVTVGSQLATKVSILSAQWMAAVETYASVLLRMRDFETARCLLTEFTDRQPYRERAWGQLMVACGNSGDVAAAVAAYRRARRHLIDGLGVEPSNELSGLYRAILRGEPEVRLASEALRPPVRIAARA